MAGNTGRVKAGKKDICTGLDMLEEQYVQNLMLGMSKIDAYLSAFKPAASKTPKANKEAQARLYNRHTIKTRIRGLEAIYKERAAVNRDKLVNGLNDIFEYGMEKYISISKEGGAVEKMKDTAASLKSADTMFKLEGMYAAEKVETEVRTKGKFVINLLPRTDGK